MKQAARFQRDETSRRTSARALAEQAFSRAAGASLIPGNQVRLLRDARENYPAWLAAIRDARRYVHLESYIIHEDSAGRDFADALIAKARQGVRVRVIYDWLGSLGKTSRRFWNRLRSAGIEVRSYNPPRPDTPFGWLSRDHRKMLAVDGEIGFITGLCVGVAWLGNPKKNIDPWRDTGVEVRGRAVADIEAAFAQVWASTGDAMSTGETVSSNADADAGDMAVRVVATVPMTAGIRRVDELVAALASERLWLADAYYAGMTSFVEALKAAARDGVDVRLLVPNATDIPLVRFFSRAGYRTLLEAGVRVFEWNGPMMHAKTAVADGRWARVGSSNLNISSWFGNYELDLVVEDQRFAQDMERMYLDDLKNSTEIVLDLRKKIRAPGEPPRSKRSDSQGGGSVGRAAAGAFRVGSAVAAAFTNRRVFEPVEVRILIMAGLLLFGLAALFLFFPDVLVYPLIAVFVWTGAALLYQGYKLHRKGRGHPKE